MPMSIPHAPLGRHRRTELLALADRAELLTLADHCLESADPPELLSGPEVGTVVLTVREPVESIRFHLGDVLVTRSEVQHRGARGWSMRMGSDRAACLAAAICDAEAEANGPGTNAIAELCHRTEQRLTFERQQEWAMLETTIVRFEEMTQ